MRSKEYQNGQWRLAVGKPIFVKFTTAETGGLLSILLNARGTQAGKAVLVDRELPGQEFVHGQGVAAASLLERQEATADGGDDFGFAADDPTLGPGCGQIRNC